MPWLLLLSLSLSIVLGGCSDPPSRPQGAVRAEHGPQAGTPAALRPLQRARADVRVAGVQQRMHLLVPQAQSEQAWSTRVWLDTAADDGLPMQTLAVQDFVAMGAAAAERIAALVLPDHGLQRLSDEAVRAVRAYVHAGGKLMLVYDAGVLNEDGKFAASRSRLSDLAGVDYALYGSLMDKLVGLGPVISTKAHLTSLGFAPGKFTPYTGLRADVSMQAVLPPAGMARYVPADSQDPGSTRRLAEFLIKRPGSRVHESTHRHRQLLRPRTEDAYPPDIVQELARHTKVERTVEDVTLALTSLRGEGAVTAATHETGSPPAYIRGFERGTTPLHQISGYGYDHLDYPSYITKGSYTGTALLASPWHGLVAGVRHVGAGRVLFANLPLGYLKAWGADSAPIHGLLQYFAVGLAGLPQLSQQPDGVGGLVYHWQVDDRVDLDELKSIVDESNVFQRGPFSVHVTTGPDVAARGDGRGVNLAGSAAAQKLVQQLQALRIHDAAPDGQAADPDQGLRPHVIAAHGGWQHDLWQAGPRAADGQGGAVVDTGILLAMLKANVTDVLRWTGEAAIEYSAPGSWHPDAALAWLSEQGVRGVVVGSDTGHSALRSYQAGQLRHPAIWSFPLAVAARSATFEDFEDNNVMPSQMLKWLGELQDFVAARRTHRVFYNHPFGARRHLTSVVVPMLDRADLLIGTQRFRWYTVTELTRFLQRRSQTVWDCSLAARQLQLRASNGAGLQGQVWQIPKARYTAPVVLTGDAEILADPAFYLVRAKSGQSLHVQASLVAP